MSVEVLYPHLTIFQDHNGHDAARAWHSVHIPADQTDTLPPPFSYHIYVTHPVEDLRALTDRLFTVLMTDQSSVGDLWRFEIFHSPSATPQACKAHYLAERVARVSNTGANLPLTIYHNTDLYWYWRHIIFILDDPDWTSHDNVKVLRFNDNDREELVEVPFKLAHSGDPNDDMGFHEQLHRLWYWDERRSEIEDSFYPEDNESQDEDSEEDGSSDE